MRLQTLLGLLGAVLLCLAPTGTAAQRYLVHTYSEAEGLPSSSVRGIMQDSSGIMWFATRAGLATYDGATWTRDPFGGEPLFDQAHILEDSRGVIWSVNWRTPVRVVHSEDRTWKHLPPFVPPSRALYSMHLAVLHHASATYVLVATDANDLCFWDGESWTVIDTGMDRDSDTIHAIQALENTFLLATSTGLHVFDPLRPRAELSRYEGVQPGAICGVEFDEASRRLWLIGVDWIGHVRGAALEKWASRLDLQPLHPLLQSYLVSPDALGGVYLAILTRLFYFHPRHGLEPLDESNGLISGGATAFCMDREGNQWIGSLRGVSKIVSRRFASYDREHGLYSDEVSAVIEMQNGAMVLGHPGGLTFLGTPSTTMHLGEDFKSRVLDLAEDRLGNLWVAAEYRGLVRLDASGDVQSFGRAEGMVQVSSVHVDAAGTLWVAASNKLFYRENERFVEFALPRSGLGHLPHIRKIDEGADGRLYLSTNHGAYSIGNDKVEWWTHPEGGLAAEVFVVHETENDERWIGTRAGLYRAVDGKFEVAREGPAVTRPIYFILRDTGQRVWFGTDHGVQRWDGEELRRYSVHDGLIGLEANRAAGVLDSSGHVWIGTDRGVSVYRAEFDGPRPGPPLVRLLEMESAGDTLSLTTDHAFEHDRNGITFRFTAISFVDENSVRFRYRLDGFEDAWQGPDPLPLREVRYTNVPPGTYQFQIQAIDVEGRLSATAISAKVTIRHPIWAQLWFRLLVGGFGVAMLYVIVTSILKSRYAKRLEDSQRRLLALFDHSIDAICLLDDAGEIVAANPTMCALTGDGHEALERTRAIRVVPREECDAVLESWKKFRREGQTAGESRVLHRNGSVADVEYHAVANITPGLHLLTLRDITARKKTEDALRRSERLASIGTLAAGIAHEINNPVGGIRMAAQFALRARQDPAAKRIMETALRDVEEDSKRCGQIVDSVLRLAQRIPPEKQPCDMNGVVRAAVESSRGYAEERESVIRFVPAAADPYVLANPSELERAFGNMIRNAIESDASMVDVEVHVEGATSAACVRVADDGRGMPAPDLDRLFDPFFTTRRKYGGTGLGLSLVHVIVNDHGGAVDVQSALGEGSTFTVRLPVHERMKSANDEGLDR